MGEGRRMLGRTRMAVLVAGAATVVGVGASSALAGEITGNGTLKEPNGNSYCDFSGQEDLQWYTTNTDTTLKPDPVKGDPAHSQSWGQIPQSVRDILTQEGYYPG